MLVALSPREHVVGVDIGGGLVTAAEVKIDRGGRVRLVNAGWEPVALDASEETVGHAVRRLWQTCGFSTYSVCSCLRSRSLVVGPFAYPNLSPRELEGALWLEAEESLRLPRNQIAMDWCLDGSQTDGNGMQGILVAAPLAEVTRNAAVLEAAGLFPVVMDVGCMAVANLYLALREDGADDETVCLVNLCGGTADVALLYGGDRILPRTVVSLVGGWHAAPDYLASNINDVLKYYEFKLRRGTVAKVKLTGQIPPESAFWDRLGKAVMVPIEVWDPVLDIRRKPFHVVRRFREDEHKRLAVAASLGVALR